jgi:GDP-D-mannose 3', 5'-epimerase
MPFQKEWAKKEGILRSSPETRIVRFHNVFGPLGTWQGGRERALAALCRKIAAAQLEGLNEIEIWGDGEQTRSLC